MKGVVVLSGKSGTGKESIVASFAAMARSKALVDCDVDAADPTCSSNQLLSRSMSSGVDRSPLLMRKSANSGKIMLFVTQEFEESPCCDN